MKKEGLENAVFADRRRGSLIAGAAGDALGYAVEFMSRNMILKRYGPQGIEHLQIDRNAGKAVISDDTQMTLFTAEGLLQPEGDPIKNIYLAYRNWYLTQNVDYPAKQEFAPSALLLEPALFRCRAPGNTCLGALGSGYMGTLEEPINNSSGCGGVMRVAPVGFLRDIDAIEAAKLAMAAAAVTHGHPNGYLPAGLLAYIVHICIYENPSGRALSEIVESSITAFAAHFAALPKIVPFIAFMRRAAQLAKNSDADIANIVSLGEGWVGDEALAIAIYCALRHADDLSAALRAAVNHSGDSDSTGAIAGNILGAYLGAEAIGEAWTAKLEFYDLLKDMADRFGC